MQHRRIHAGGILLALLALAVVPGAADSILGYYRYPAIHGDTIVFTAEGDLWKVGLEGGVAQRLTSHLAQETRAAFSPDGSQLAFSANYEGSTEVYIMSVAGGLPKRFTFEGGSAQVVGWTPDGKVLYATRHESTLPNTQLIAIDPGSGTREILPLHQASDGVYGGRGNRTLFFVRLPFQGSHAKRYKGGTAQKLWRFDAPGREATPLAADYPGTSKDPMWWQGRLYFLSDRDGTMNVWSMTAEGGDLRQHTPHDGWDAKEATLSGGRIVYQLGADLWLYEIASGRNERLDIRLASDLDQLRVRWVKNPMSYLSAAHLSPSGDRVVLTARGEVFVAPVKQGRLVEATRNSGVRYRSGRFFPGGKSLMVLSDESGEIEFWRVDARGRGVPRQITTGNDILRFDGVPSPDGKWIAFSDKNFDIWIADAASGARKKIDTSDNGGVGSLSWSPDSRWVAYAITTANLFDEVRLYNRETGTITSVSGARFDSSSPVWSEDGNWLAFLSNRNLVSLQPSPWGSYAPGPYLDRRTKLYLVALRPGLRSPFQPDDELQPPGEEKKPGGEKKEEEKSKAIEIELAGLRQRIVEVPVPPGNYRTLTASKTHLFYLSTDISPQRTTSLMVLKLGNEEVKPVELLTGVSNYELSADGKKLLVRRRNDLYVLPANDKKPRELAKAKVNLANWTFALDPREEYRQMLTDAWRLHRDYFYDPNMHNVGWDQMLEKYRPLVSRVTDRVELNDLVAQMISELSALHHSVRGGDLRRGQDNVLPAGLGARYERDERAGGFRITRLFRTDPDLPNELSPLLRPGVNVKEGDTITAVNGQSALSVQQIGELLRNQAGKQVLLEVKAKDSGETREVVVIPVTSRQASGLRYSAWEFERRRRVNGMSGSQIGYVHLRAMGGRNYTEWARNFYPVFNRPGLIVDVRHNRGGNIDSWILDTLLRRAWMWWKGRVGMPYSNMQYAYIGHVVVLVDEWTASDGEAFAEGFRRLGLGKIIGTRTWGGEIWLSGSNRVVDRGVARAAESGVYGPEGEWLIEGHGVEPDIVVDNLPHATFNGEDAQLKAAVEYLQKLMREQPVNVPKPPPYPNMARPPRN